jgi:hypothetical protein
MIYEFAIDPAVVATWTDPRRWAVFKSQIGFGTVRVVCEFPDKNWKTMVVSAASSLAANDEKVAQQQMRKRLEVLLNHLCQRCTRRPVDEVAEEQWIDAALRQHGRFPFGGILAESSADGVVRPSVIERGDANSLWEFPNKPVRRTASGLAQALAPLLRCSRKIRLVDPYFDVKSKYLDVLRALLAEMVRFRSSELSLVETEIHFAIHPSDRAGFPGRSDLQIARDLMSGYQSAILGVLAKGHKLRMVAWAEWPGRRAGRDQLHNRYVLTEIGGVMLGAGLDLSERGEAFDDLTVLSAEQFSVRWSQYSFGGTAFERLAFLDLVGS